MVVAMVIVMVMIMMTMTVTGREAMTPQQMLKRPRQATTSPSCSSIPHRYGPESTGDTCQVSQ